MTDGLACERALVDAQTNGLQQRAVGRHLVACAEEHDVAHHHVASCYLRGVAVAHDLHRLVVVHLVEQGKFLFGFHFKIEGKTCGEEYGHEDAYGLEENFVALVQTELLVHGNADGEHAGDEQDDNEGVGKFLKKLAPQRLLGGWCEHVAAVCGTAGCHLGRRESACRVGGWGLHGLVCVHYIKKE